MAVKPKAVEPRKLTPRQRAFVEEYLTDLNAMAAYIRAGFSAKGADHHAHELLRAPHVAAAVAEAMEVRSKRVAVTADMVLERWWKIATADPNDLIQFRRTACRYCHGVDHAYQWQDAEELRRAIAAAAGATGKFTPPDDSGGLGFVATADPHPDCPKCNGEGCGIVHANDTRRLKGAAALLYAGAKETKDGFEIKLIDQAKALENVARHLGMFVDKVEHSGKIDFAEMSEEQLLAEIAAYKPNGT
ncbi:phage terminase small subunit [Sphingomonas sp. BE270]|uniref:terminase small subunit n=1 Tax=Sphingomonas sp. BE270 TaxID=2817726 RepID=UPI0028677958|nr:terminase small subunit [Sphingomonas sp. BE270]MDR7257801.1 phage terminase small subunit [Sphingomonas sp. BE270]